MNRRCCVRSSIFDVAMVCDIDDVLINALFEDTTFVMPFWSPLGSLLHKIDKIVAKFNV
jgi:hypothetical protein